jgi:polyisoprenoid-binding protein YceI
MKKILLSTMALAIAAITFAGNGEKNTYKVDNKLSNLEWTGKKVTGEHTGTIAVKEGSIMVENNMIKSGTIEFDMTSINCTDLEGEYKGKLEGHLKSDDFFSVEKHTASTLKIKSVKKTEGQDTYEITGDLTIKGITHPTTFPAVIKMEDNKLVAIGTVDINRTKYDIKYGSGQFFDGLGDKMIYDDFTVKFKLGAKS